MAHAIASLHVPSNRPVTIERGGRDAAISDDVLPGALGYCLSHLQVSMPSVLNQSVVMSRI